MAPGIAVVIRGHLVDTDQHDLDAFYSMKDGRPTTDEEWDISRDRVKAAEALEGDDAITWEVIN